MEAPRLFNTQTSDIFRLYEVRKRQVQGTQISFIISYTNRKTFHYMNKYIVLIACSNWFNFILNLLELLVTSIVD